MIVERTLHHFPLDPASRQVRLALGEKRLPFREVIERYWEPAREPGHAQPLRPDPGAGARPRGAAQVVLCESRADPRAPARSSYPEPPLLVRDDPAERAEARRLLQWFDRKFDYEVNGLLLHEKMEKRLLGLGAPDLAALRRGREALESHLGYMEEPAAGARLAGRARGSPSPTSPPPRTCR